MAIVPGTNCAAALVALRLPSAAIVQDLMMEVGLTHAEATNAALTAHAVTPRILDAERRHRARIRSEQQRR